MKKILIIIIRLTSVVLIIPPLVLALPGIILNILSDEMDDKNDEHV